MPAAAAAAAAAAAPLSGLTLCDPMDCSPPGSSVHGIFQARILERVAIFLLQVIFPTQESNPSLLCLLHCRWILYLLSHQGSPIRMPSTPWWFSGKESACNAGNLQEIWVQSLGREEPLEKEMETHYSILAWKSPWTEEPDRLHFVRSQRVVYI